MDWATVITSMSAIGIVEGSFRIIDKIRFKKEEKQEKKESVEQTAVATDKQQIDLGDMFLEKTIKWGEMIEQNTEKMVNRMMEKLDENNEKRDKDWEDLKRDMGYMKGEIADIKGCLNGKLEDYKKSKYEKNAV